MKTKIKTHRRNALVYVPLDTPLATDRISSLEDKLQNLIAHLTGEVGPTLKLIKALEIVQL